MPAGKMVKRELFTKSEDKEIIKYIIENDEYLKVKGTKIWIHLSSIFYERCGTHRTWQSLKERYIKRIITKIGDFKLDSEIEKKLLQMFPDKNHAEEGKNKSPMNKQAEVKKKPKCHYTSEDDQVILQWVLNHPTKHVKGNIMWQELESFIALKDRTWASLKDRFLKHLVGKAKDMLEPEDADKILRIVEGDTSIIEPYFRNKGTNHPRQESNHVGKKSAAKATNSPSKSAVGTHSPSSTRTTSRGHDRKVSNKTACEADQDSECDDPRTPEWNRSRKRRRIEETDSEDEASHCEEPANRTGTQEKSPRLPEKRLSLKENENERVKIKVEPGLDEPEDGEGCGMKVFLSNDLGTTRVDPLTETLYVHGEVNVNGKLMSLGVPNFPVLHPIS